MANTHAVVNLTSAAAWDVDSLNLVGICAGADIDNGNFVTLGDMNVDATSKVVGGYEFAVTSATTTSADYIVATPVVGSDIEMQIHSDPRYFYNKAGQPMSVKRLLIGDCIEVTAAAFSTAPTVGASTHAKVTAGKLVAQANDTGAQFKILGVVNLDIGQDIVPAYVLMKIA